MAGVLNKSGNYVYFQSFEEGFEVSYLRDFVNIFRNKDTIIIGHNLVEYDLVVLGIILKRKGGISNDECNKISDDVMGNKHMYFNRQSWHRVLDTKHFINKSLKTCALSLNSEDIIEDDISGYISNSDAKIVKSSNTSDLKNILQITKSLEPQFSSRADLEKKIRNSSVWHTSPLTISTKVLNFKRLSHSLLKEIPLKDVIIKRDFTNPTLIDFQKRLREKIYPHNPLSETIKIDGLDLLFRKTDVKGLRNGQVLNVSSGENGQLFELAFSSFYLSVILAFEIFPVGIDKEEFLRRLRGLIDSKAQAKNEGNNVRTDSIEIIIGSVFSHLSNKKGELYDPSAMLKICLNAQLILLELFDLISSSCKCLMVNKDKILVWLTPDNKKRVFFLVDSFSSKIKIPIEINFLKKMYAISVNDYIAIESQGTLRLKGRFKDPIRSISVPKYPEACRLAAIDHIQYGIPIKDCLSSQPYINFLYKEQCMSNIWINGNQTTQKSVRYVISPKGGSEIYYKRSNGDLVSLSPQDRLKCTMFNLKDVYSLDYKHYILATEFFLINHDSSKDISILNSIISVFPYSDHPNRRDNMCIKALIKKIKGDETNHKRIKKFRSRGLGLKDLPEVLIQGIFTSKSSEGLVSFSGLFPICICGEKYDLNFGIKDLGEMFFMSYPWMLAVFLSPSGRSLTVIGWSKDIKDKDSYMSVVKRAHTIIGGLVRTVALSLEESLGIDDGFPMPHDPDIFIRENPISLDLED